MSAADCATGQVWRYEAGSRTGQHVCIIKTCLNYVMIRRVGARKKRWIGRTAFSKTFAFFQEDQKI